MAIGTVQVPKNPLLKRIGVEIDRSSWTGQYAFPAELAIASSLTDINFASALLWMGVASLVQTVPRWWTAIRWAQAKYAYAVDSDSDLRLHPEMVDLEKHQKSVLSDEWGIGVALEWLTNAFQYRQICHGDIAVREFRRRGLLKTYPEHKKNGHQKCPDFVALDPHKKLHIIECKGTTQGRSTIKAAFKTAYEQKHSIRFHNDGAFVSQRLSVGLAIASDPKAKRTTLYVEDPDESRRPLSAGGYFVADKVQPRQIEEAVLTSMLIEQSALAGAFDVLAIASATYGQHETGTVLLGRELPPDMVKFEAEDKVWIGQQFEAVSPVALHPDHGRSLIKIRSGMSSQLHHSLLEPRVWNEPERVMEMLDTGMTPLKRDGSDKLVLRSSIQFGSGFISDLTITELGK